MCQGGWPEVLEIRELPVPAVREGWSLVQVKAAGLNRSELRTRQGHSPNVTFPRVLGIECVGIVADSTDPRLHSHNVKGSVGPTLLQHVVREVEAGVYRRNVDRVFGLDDIVAAHRYMESNQATGKLVVVP
ncbi:MAG: zinc-binding dehydrogenase [Solirubrobacteraceae bacterium]